jgi:hypothetical protein
MLHKTSGADEAFPVVEMPVPTGAANAKTGYICGTLKF